MSVDVKLPWYIAQQRYKDSKTKHAFYLKLQILNLLWQVCVVWLWIDFITHITNGICWAIVRSYHRCVCDGVLALYNTLLHTRWQRAFNCMLAYCWMLSVNTLALRVGLVWLPKPFNNKNVLHLWWAPTQTCPCGLSAYIQYFRNAYKSVCEILLPNVSAQQTH